MKVFVKWCWVSNIVGSYNHYTSRTCTGIPLYLLLVHLLIFLKLTKKFFFVTKPILTSFFILFWPDDEDIRENLSTASLDTIVERAKSAEPATQLAAVQVKLFPTNLQPRFISNFDKVLV